MIGSELTHFSETGHCICDIIRKLCEKVILGMGGQEWMMVGGCPFSAKHHLDLSEGKYYPFSTMIGSEQTPFSYTGHLICDIARKLHLKLILVWVAKDG